MHAFEFCVNIGECLREGALDHYREPPPGLPASAANWTWATLMRRAFAIDVLACPRCGGRLRVIATVEDPLVVRGSSRPTGRPSR
jgi:hypothetical protein